MKVALLPAILLAAMLFGCNGGEMKEGAPTAAGGGLTQAQFDVLRKRRIFFGHQSVGRGILDTLAALSPPDGGPKLTLVEGDRSYRWNGGALVHFRVGHNRDPGSKIASFAAEVANGVGEKADIAGFKLCFADIDGATDAGRLFLEYRSAMAALRKRYPDITFIHVTVPLTVVQGGLKASVKRLMGRLPGGYAENIRRHQFNELLRAECDGGEPLFDLAELESRDPDGRRNSFEYDGKLYPALATLYSSDGGHLNDRGRKITAEAFLSFLATVQIKERSR